MMKRLSFISCLFLFLTIVPVIAADCPALVKQALAATDMLCHDTEKNQACYGNINLKAQPIANAESFRFNRPGDIASLSDIKSLQLSPMSIETGEWGVALMNVEANLSASKSANLTLLAFGDVTLENDVMPPTTMDVQIVGQQPINVRLLPNVKAGVIGTLPPNQIVSALERLGDSSWLRVKLPNSEQMGWVSADFISGTGDIRTLNIVDANQPHYKPMQAFTFKSGSPSQNCAEVPQDGLIIQTPEGSGEVQLWINQVVVKLGSTVYFQAQPGGDMVVTTVEGHATVESMGVSYTAVEGSSVHVKLDADLNPISAPSQPQAYEMVNVANLPIDHLQRKITIHAPLTAQELVTVQNGQSGASTVIDSTNSGNSENVNNSNNNNCPGNSCHNGINNNNGQNDNCPGNSCHTNSNNSNGNDASNNDKKDKDKDKDKHG